MSDEEKPVSDLWVNPLGDSPKAQEATPGCGAALLRAVESARPSPLVEAMLGINKPTEREMTLMRLRMADAALKIAFGTNGRETIA